LPFTEALPTRKNPRGHFYLWQQASRHTHRPRR
jgi:hypothetical protein